MSNKYRLLTEGSLLVQDNEGGIPILSQQDGTRLLFVPGPQHLGAFKVGTASSSSNNATFDANASQNSLLVGKASVTFGVNAMASQAFGFAFGYNAQARGEGAFAGGSKSRALGNYSYSFGQNVLSGEDQQWSWGAVTYGMNSIVRKHGGVSYGWGNTVGRDSDDFVGAFSMAVGSQVLVEDSSSLGFGQNINITTQRDISVPTQDQDYNASPPAFHSLAFGHTVDVKSHHAFAFGSQVEIDGNSPYTILAANQSSISGKSRGVVAAGDHVVVKAGQYSPSSFTLALGCGQTVEGSTSSIVVGSHTSVSESSGAFAQGGPIRLSGSMFAFVRGQNIVDNSHSSFINGANAPVSNSPFAFVHGGMNFVDSANSSVVFGNSNFIDGAWSNFVNGISNKVNTGTKVSATFGVFNELKNSTSSIVSGFGLYVEDSSYTTAVGAKGGDPLRPDSGKIIKSKNSHLHATESCIINSPNSRAIGEGVSIKGSHNTFAGGDNVTVDTTNFNSNLKMGWSMAYGANIKALSTNDRPTTAFVALGSNIDVTGSVGSVSLGQNIDMLGHHSIAGGYDVNVEGDGSVALGWTANAYGDMSQAIGHNVTVGSSGTNIMGLALGCSAEVTHHGGVAIGGNVQATASNAIALGACDISPLVNDKANSLKVGFEGGNTTLFAQSLANDSRVGVNTDTPEADFHVEGVAYVSDHIRLKELVNDVVGVADRGSIFHKDNDVWFVDTNGSPVSLTASGGGGGGGGATTPWSTTGSDVFRNSGSVMVGLNSGPLASLHVQGEDSVDTANAFIAEGLNSNGRFTVKNDGSVELKQLGNASGDSIFRILDASIGGNSDAVFGVSSLPNNTKIKSHDTFSFTNAEHIVFNALNNFTIDAESIAPFGNAGASFKALAFEFDGNVSITGDTAIANGKAIKFNGTTGLIKENIDATNSINRLGLFNEAGDTAFATVDDNGYWITKINDSVNGIAGTDLYNGELSFHMNGSSLNGVYKDDNGLVHDLSFGSQADENIGKNDLTLQGNRKLTLDSKSLEFDGGAALDVKFTSATNEFVAIGNDATKGSLLEIHDGTSASIALNAKSSSKIKNGLSIGEDGTGSTVHIGGSLSLKHKVASAAIVNLNADDHIIYANATTEDVVVNLPEASTVNGRLYHIKRKDNSTNSVTIVANGSQTIDGQNTIVIANQYDSYQIHCDGTEWFIL